MLECRLDDRTRYRIATVIDDSGLSSGHDITYTVHCGCLKKFRKSRGSDDIFSDVFQTIFSVS